MSCAFDIPLIFTIQNPDIRLLTSLWYPDVRYPLNYLHPPEIYCMSASYSADICHLLFSEQEVWNSHTNCDALCVNRKCEHKIWACASKFFYALFYIINFSNFLKFCLHSSHIVLSWPWWEECWPVIGQHVVYYPDVWMSIWLVQQLPTQKNKKDFKTKVVKPF